MSSILSTLFILFINLYRVTLTIQKYYDASFLFGTWLWNLHV